LNKQTLCSGGGTAYELSPDGSRWYYWTGAAWAIANGTYAEATAASSLTPSVMSTFALQAGIGGVYFKAFLKSDGTHACELDDLAIVGVQ
jgi:hypothetical protein